MNREYFYNLYLKSSDPKKEFDQVLEAEELLGLDSVLDSIKLRMKAYAQSLEKSRPEVAKAICEAVEKVIA